MQWHAISENVFSSSNHFLLSKKTAVPALISDNDKCNFTLKLLTDVNFLKIGKCWGIAATAAAQAGQLKIPVLCSTIVRADRQDMALASSVNQDSKSSAYEAWRRIEIAVPHPPPSPTALLAH